MRFAIRKPLLTLVVLTIGSSLIAAAIAIRQQFSLCAALGSWFGALAFAQFAYLGLVIGFGEDESFEPVIADPAPPGLR